MKPSTAKAKGRETENRFVAFVRPLVPHIERRRLKGNKDEGDTTGWPGVCVEVKSGARLDIPAWLRELDIETVNANADPAPSFLVIRPKNQPDPRDWFIVRRLPNDLELLRMAGWIAERQEGAA